MLKIRDNVDLKELEKYGFYDNNWGTHIIEHHIPVMGLPGIAVIVDAEIVLSGRNDGGKAGAFRAELGQRPVEFRLILVFVHSRTGSTHHGKDSRFRFLLRFPKRLDLLRRFDGAENTQYFAGIPDHHMGMRRSQPLCKVMGGSCHIRRQLPVGIQIYLSKISCRQDLLQVRVKSICKAYIPDAGNFFCFIGLYPTASPPLCHKIRRQDVQPLPDCRISILLRQKNCLLAGKTRQIDEVPLRKEGIKLVICSAKLLTGKQNQKRAGLHLLIKPAAVADKIGCMHHTAHLQKTDNYIVIQILKFAMENSFTPYYKAGKERKKPSVIRTGIAGSGFIAHGLYPSMIIWRNNKRTSIRMSSACRKSPSGLSAKFLQSAARTPCAPMAHNSHTCNLRCIFVHVHAAAKNDFNEFAAFAANSARPFSTV